MRLPTRRSLLLLAILTESDEGRLSRSRLAETIWPDSDSKAARDSLRNELATLRRSEAREVLEADSGHVWLVPGQVVCDWLEMRGHADYAGDFMPGFEHDWVIDQRLRLRTAACESAMQEARFQSCQGRKKRALALAHRACQIDPLCQAAEALRVALLEELGKTGAALATSDKFRTRVFRQLGVVSDVRPSSPAPPSHHPLIEACRWMIERDPREALGMIAATPTQWHSMPIEASIELHRRALDAVPDQGSARRMVEGQYAYLSVLAGRLYQIEEQAETSYALAKEHGEPLAAARLSIALAYGNLSKGHFKRSYEYAKRSLSDASHSADPQSAVEFEIHWSVILDHVGFHDEARHALERCWPRIERYGAPQLIASYQVIELDHLVKSAKYDAAMDRLVSARRIYESFGLGRVEAWIRMCEAVLYEAVGEKDEALCTLEQILSLSRDDVGHSALAMARDRMANLRCRIGEFRDAADAFAQASVFRNSLGAVPSISESRLIRTTRRALATKLEDRELRAAFQRASQSRG